MLANTAINDEAAGNPNNVKLCKVQEFINIISENCSIKYLMGCHNSIDERLIPFKGRLPFRQFIPSKQAHFCIKCWVLADAGNSFVSQICVYAGA